jgi:hypothetical protein
MGVMQKPVEGGCCYRIISHDFSPFSKDFVAGQNDRSMLVARIYELDVITGAKLQEITGLKLQTPA